MRAVENFHAAGGQSNAYASANAATELKSAVADALEEFASQNKENAMAVNEVKAVRDKMDTLQEAVALLAESVAGREVLTSQKRGRKNRRRRVAAKSSDEEDSSSSEEEDEPTPPPKKRKKKKKQQTKKATVKKETKSRGLSYDVDKPYKRGMKYNAEWSKGKRTAFIATQKEFHHGGTQDAIEDKVDGMKAMIKRRKKNGATDKVIGELTKAKEKWEEKLE